MQHQEILKKYFLLEPREDWVACFPQDKSLLYGFRTPRVAKIYGSDFYLTIGETQKGRKNQLTRKIEQIIVNKGLHVLKKDSTQGNIGSDKVYTGFNLSDCSPQTFESILTLIYQAISDCK